MKLARVVGRVFCAKQEPGIDGKTLLLIQPLRWEDESPAGEPVVAADVVGAGAGEKVFWVASREAAMAFPDVPPVDAAIVGIVDGHQVGKLAKGSL
ncbi:MAG: EutN/CcmL family microcompartment protein [Elusimicrobia bacterium]|nr:EutN/CcmL family microcompartment protein [Elusimicrobiota bacterium]